MKKSSFHISGMHPSASFALTAEKFFEACLKDGKKTMPLLPRHYFPSTSHAGFIYNLGHGTTGKSGQQNDMVKKDAFYADLWLNYYHTKNRMIWN